DLEREQAAADAALADHLDLGERLTGGAGPGPEASGAGRARVRCAHPFRPSGTIAHNEEDLARLYGRLGFRTVATALIAEA
ncbi:hypothetical protein ACWCQC_29545, partial [Streptomyces sp. NPDC002394]